MIQIITTYKQDSVKPDFFCSARVLSSYGMGVISFQPKGENSFIIMDFSFTTLRRNDDLVWYSKKRDDTI